MPNEYNDITDEIVDDQDIGGGGNGTDTTKNGGGQAAAFLKQIGKVQEPLPADSGGMAAKFLEDVKKNETPSPSKNGGVISGIVVPVGTKKTSPSKSQSGSVLQGVTETIPFSFEDKDKEAQSNFLNKKLTYSDIGWLAPTSFGQANGLDKIYQKAGGNIHVLQSLADDYNSKNNSDISKDATDLISANIPGVDPKFVLSGNPETITKAKDAIIGQLQTKKEEIEYRYSPNNPRGQTGRQMTEDEKRQIDEINSDIEKAKNTFATVAGDAAFAKYKNISGGISDLTLREDIGKTIQQNITPASWFNKLETVQGAKKNAVRTLSVIDTADIPKSVKQPIRASANKIYLAAENIDYQRESMGVSAAIDNTERQLKQDRWEYFKTDDPELKIKVDEGVSKLQSYREKQQGIFNKYPQAGLDQTNSLLGDKISELFNNPITITPGMVDFAAKEIQKENPNFLPTMGRFVEMSKQHPNKIPLGGFIGGFKTGMYNIGKDVDKLFGGKVAEFSLKGEKQAGQILEGENTAIKGTSYTEPTQIVFDNEGKTFRTIPSTHYSMNNWSSHMRGLGKALPSLTEFILLDKGFGAAAKVVGDFGVSGINSLIRDVKTTDALVGAETGAITATKPVQLYAGFQRDMGLLGALHVTGYDSNYEEAERLLGEGSDETKKQLLANAFTGMSFLSFKMLGISPTTAAQNAITKSAMPDAIKLLNEKGIDAIKKDGIEQFFTESFLPRAQKLLKPGVELGAAMVLDQNARGYLGSLINPKEAHIPSLKEDINTMTSQVLLMGAIGLPGMVTSGKFSPTNRDALYQAGLNWPAQISKINEMVRDGSIDQQKANHLIATIKTLGQEVWKTENQTNAQGLPLSTKQRIDISLQNFRQRYAKDLEQKGVIKDANPIIEEAQKNIDEIKLKNDLEEVKINDDGTVTKVEPVKAEDLSPEGNAVPEGVMESKPIGEGVAAKKIQEQSDIYHEYNNPDIKVQDGDLKGKGEFKRGVKELEDNTGENVVRTVANIADLSTTENIYGLSGKKDLSKYEEEINSGVQAPITVEFNGESFDVMDGHHRLEAYKKLGYKEVPIVVNESGEFYLSAKKFGIDVSKLNEMSGKEIEQIRNDIKKSKSEQQGKGVQGGGEDIAAKKAEIEKRKNDDSDIKRNPVSDDEWHKQYGNETWDFVKPDGTRGGVVLDNFKDGEKRTDAEKVKIVKEIKDRLYDDELSQLENQKQGVGVGEGEVKNKQQQVNDLMDDVTAFNKLPKNAKNRSYELNQLKVRANDLGLRFDDTRGRLFNENGKRVVKISADKPSSLSPDFNDADYSPETKQHIETLSKNTDALLGLPVIGNDGRQLSRGQMEAALKSAKDGKPSRAAKSLHDFIEDAVETGNIELVNKETGQAVKVPVNEYFDLFKEPVKELTDAEIDQLNFELSEDSFNFNDEYYGQERLPKETEQPSPKGTIQGQKKTGSGEKNTQSGSEAQVDENSPKVNQSDKQGTFPPKESIQSETDVNKEGKGTEKTGTSQNPPEKPIPEGTGGEIKPPIEGGESGSGLSEDQIGGITHAANEVRRQERGLPEYEKNPQSFEQWNNEAEKLLKEGYDVDALMDNIEKGHDPTPVENAIRKIYYATVDAEVKKNPTDELLSRQKRMATVGDIANSRAGLNLVSLKGEGSPLSTISDFYVAKMEAAGVDKLTEQQKKETKEAFEKVEKADENAAAAMEAFREEIAQLKAENEILKQKKATPKKSHGDRVQQRKDAVDGAREALKKLRTGESGLSAVPLPGLREFIAIAPHVKKYVGSLLGEGADNLATVVKKAYEAFKDVLEGITEKDIHNILAGEFNEPKPTINELTARMRDIQDEAYYINKLDRLLKGEPPKLEKKKVARNQQITELQKKIKDLQKELPPTDAELQKRLDAIKTKNENEVIKIKERIKNKDFAPKKQVPFLEDKEMQRKFPEKYNAALDAIKEKEDARHEFEIAILRDEMSKRKFGQKATDALSKGAGTVKAITTGIDDSAVAIQTYMSLLVRPRTGLKALYEHFRQGASQKKFDRWLTALHSSSDFKFMKEAGLDVTEPSSLKEREKEEIFSTRFNGTIKIKGKEYKLIDAPLKPFERAFTTLGNVTRVVGFRTNAARYMRKGYTWENSPELFKSLAQRLNTETGRGKVNEYVDKANKIVTLAIWSPRLMAMKFNLLGVSDVASLILSKAGTKGYYRQLHPIERAEAIKDIAQFATTVMAITYGVALAAGGKVDDDPLSSTFMDVKMPNGKSYNFTGGFSGYIRNIAQFVTGKKHKDGKTIRVNPLNTAGQFFKGKRPPLTGAVLNTISGKDYMGKPTTPLKEAYNLLPISGRGIAQQIQNDGATSFFDQGIPTFFGLNVKNEEDYQSTAKINLKYKDSKGNYINRDSTPEEHKAYEESKDKKAEKYLKEYETGSKPLYINVYGEVSIEKYTEGKKGKPIKFSDLTDDQEKKLNTKIKAKAGREAEQELTDKLEKQ